MINVWEYERKAEEKGDPRMRILKTPEQVREEKARQNAAITEIEHCPKCGHKTKSKDVWQSVTENIKRVYRAKCPVCGCIWESDEF